MTAHCWRDGIMPSGSADAIAPGKAARERTCAPASARADALGMSYGNYVAAGLDQVAWEGQRQTRPRTGSPIQMDHTHGGDADGSDDL